MFESVRACFGAAIVAAAIVAPAWGATVNVLPDAPVAGTFINLSVGDFERVGNCGGGGSVVGDGCSAIVKTDPLAADAYGRFDPLGNYWIDSQDIDLLKWTVTSDKAFTSMTFALTDAHDQRHSHFTMSYLDGGTWTEVWGVANRLANANLFWLVVDFAAPVTSAEFLFSTKVGSGYDGYGISSLRVVSSVPLPPAALLLLTGTMLLGAVRRRRAAV